MKKHLRIFVDIIMFILFIILMGYHITDNMLHEVLGVLTFLFFILHHILNLKWYQNIFKGKYNFYRVFQVTIDMLLLISMIGIIISSIMISSHVFAFLNIKTTMFGRSLHMVSTSWTFVLMSIHLGLHLNVILKRLKNKIKNSSFEYVYYLIIVLFMIYGIYTFIDTGLWKDMFLVSKFKFFDYNQNPLLFYLSYFSVVLFISITTYLLISYYLKRKNYKKQHIEDRKERLK